MTSLCSDITVIGWDWYGIKIISTLQETRNKMREMWPYC